MSVLGPTRPLWRFTLHERSFATAAFPADTAITELTDCRSRRLETQMNTPATLTFTIDGRSQAALYIQELTTEVMAWRYDAATGIDQLMFRGIVTQSQDSVSEQTHTVNFTAHDHLAILARRYLGGHYVTAMPRNGPSYTNEDQDTIIDSLTQSAIFMVAGDLSSLQPGSILQLRASRVNADGTNRPALSGVLRDRQYANGQSVGDAIIDLTGVLGGPDVDVLPHANVDGTDWLRIFPPKTDTGGGRGVPRPDLPLVYGTSVSSFSRSANSIDFANYLRFIGQAPEGSPTGTPPLSADAWNPDAAEGLPGDIGLWQHVENASDVKEQSTLDEKAHGALRDRGVLVPSYSLKLRPDWFHPGHPNLGDTVPLQLAVGRLAVDATVRVLGLNYAIGDDGQEDVDLTVGRPALTLTSLFTDSRRDINALARR
jgi:hypothetical protein